MGDFYLRKKDDRRYRCEINKINSFPKSKKDDLLKLPKYMIKYIIHGKSYLDQIDRLKICMSIGEIDRIYNFKKIKESRQMEMVND